MGGGLPTLAAMPIPTAGSHALLRRARALPLIAALPMLANCDALTDAATAIAYDIEAHAARFAASGEATSTLLHVPQARRGGCADTYRVQFSQAAGLVVWCRAPGSATGTVSSHITTCHLRFVDVPATTIVDKSKGEPLSIAFEKGPGKAVVVKVW
jgi:hypothetical protein